MSDKVIIKIRELSVLAGFLLVLGTFGAADWDRISLGAFIVQIIIGLFLIVIGDVGFRFTNEEY